TGPRSTGGRVLMGAACTIVAPQARVAAAASTLRLRFIGEYSSGRFVGFPRAGAAHDTAREVIDTQHETEAEPQQPALGRDELRQHRHARQPAALAAHVL